MSTFSMKSLQTRNNLHFELQVISNTEFLGSRTQISVPINVKFALRNSSRCTFSELKTNIYKKASKQQGVTKFSFDSTCLKNSQNFKCRSYNEVSGSVFGNELKMGVVVSKFNEFVTKELLAGALQAFIRHGVDSSDIDVMWVPGSFEIPIVADTMAKSGKYNAVLCIGAVIRGSTSHYDAVVSAVTSGVLTAGLNSGVPCIFGVLTCDTMEQAIDRAGGKAGNKGAECALAAVETANLLLKIKE